MAIKHSDPRKLQDIDLRGNRFDTIVADAWETRHEDETQSIRAGSPEAPRGRRAESPGRYGGADPTYQPFSELKDRLRHH